jgi:hypothetical protein
VGCHGGARCDAGCHGGAMRFSHGGSVA